MTAGSALRLILPAVQRDVLRIAAEAAYPNEFCALLIGVDDGVAARRVTGVVPAANVHPEPRTGFEVDPRVLIDVLRSLREADREGQGTGERLIGHAHSHPDGPAEPSARDLAQAYEPGQFWVVVAVKAGRTGGMGAFLAVHAPSGQAAFRAVDIED